MTEKTRRSLLAAVGVSLASAGCLSNFEAGPGEATTENATTTEVTTLTKTTTEETSTPENPITEQPASKKGTAHASDSPDPDHSITLESETGESQQVRVRVVREATGETVFETTDDPLGKHTLYNLRQADPEGVEAFRVCAELVEAKITATETATATTTTESGGSESRQRDCATIRTSECYGNAHVTVEEDGSIQIIYAIC